ncbi:MAG: PadR family transcriptional regulator [Microbacteriaceae bacterium]|nr:MAG: PadR family transcriptional regulator [Microbacteriaceae bacterium]
MSIRQSLLAILNQGPCYGYQLRSEFDRRTGSRWPLNVGQIYNTLDRLERDGLVEKADTDQAGHVYYAITSAGAAEAAGWLSSAVVRAGPARDELAIKLAIAVTLPDVDVAAVIQTQRAASLRAVQELAAIRDRSAEPISTEGLAGLLVIQSQLFAAEAEVHWLDHVQRQLAQASVAEMRAPVPLRTETPKRGRPSNTRAAAHP